MKGENTENEFVVSLIKSFSLWESNETKGNWQCIMHIKLKSQNYWDHLRQGPLNLIKCFK